MQKLSIVQNNDINKEIIIKRFKDIHFNIAQNKFINNVTNYNNNSNNSNNSTNNIQDKAYYVIKPLGKRALLLFTYINISFYSILKLQDNEEYYYCNIDFDNTLSYNNVLLYGYYFRQNNINYFIIDSVVNYNNFNYKINNNKYHDSIILKLQVILKVINNIKFNKDKDNISIYLPFISNDYNNVFNNLYNVEYIPYGINIYNKSKNIGLYVLNTRCKNIEAVFIIQALITQDTYALYCLDNKGNQVYHSNALINSYKLSVYMNKLYRNIVENNNLDLLEESDNEEDFQNTDNDKYVNLNKIYTFICTYNRKFNKWTPKNLVNDKNINIISKKQLYYIEKK